MVATYSLSCEVTLANEKGSKLKKREVYASSHRVFPRVRKKSCQRHGVVVRQ